jgi:CHAT domain-containing protein/urease accessory protein UreH
VTLTGSNLIFNNTVVGDKSLTLNSSTVTVNQPVTVGELIVNSDIQVNTDKITTTGEQSYFGTFVQQQDVTLTGSNLLFNNPVVGDKSLTLNSSTVTVNQPVTVGELVVTGDIQVNTDKITTTGEQSYFGTFVQQQDVTLTGSNLLFNNPVVGDKSLTLNSSTVTVNQPVTVGELVVNSDIQVNTDKITTTGEQSYFGTFVQQQDVTLTGSNLIFNNTVVGDKSLTLNSSTVTVNQPVTVGELVVKGDIQVNTDEITTTGEQSYFGTFVQQQDVTLTGSNLIFNNTVVGDKSLTLNAKVSTVNQSVTVGELVVTGDIQVNTDEITTTGEQSYFGTFVRDSEITLRGNNITLSDTEGNNLKLTINSQGFTKLTQNLILSTLTIEANSDITTKDLNTTSLLNTAGEINLISRQGGITTGNLNTSGINGGDINLTAQNDISVNSINTQGEITGGFVDINTPQNIRITGNIPNTQTSISIAGEIPGKVTFRYDLLNQDTPFFIGDITNNGTVGAITDGNNILVPLTTRFKDETGKIVLFLNNNELPTPFSFISSILLSNNTQSVSNVTSEKTSNNLPISIRLEKYRLTSTLDLDAAEKLLNTDFIEHLGIENVPQKSLSDIQKILKEIEQKTGIKSALVYLVFKSNNSTNSPQKQSATLNLNPQRNVKNDSKDTEILEIIVVTKSSKTQLSRPKITRKILTNAVKELQSTITNSRRPRAYLSSSQQLYQWLIEPIEKDLKNQEIENLVFILDAGLRSIPMAALHDGKQFLVEHYSLGIMPTFSLTDTRYADLRNQQILAMGASQFTEQNPLPAVPTELSLITQKIWQGESFLNTNFTLQNLKKAHASRKFRIIHLATHANFETGTLDKSYIQLWQNKLTLEQLKQLNFSDPPIDLLVLSACRTALGDREAELGFAGAAVLARVKTVLGSLWEVSDEGTLGLMTSFYQQLKISRIKAEALRQAQLEMLRGEVKLEDGNLIIGAQRFPLPPQLVKLGDRKLTHPYYWSGFTLIGSPW